MAVAEGSGAGACAIVGRRTCPREIRSAHSGRPGLLFPPAGFCAGCSFYAGCGTRRRAAHPATACADRTSLSAAGGRLSTCRIFRCRRSYLSVRVAISGHTFANVCQQLVLFGCRIGKQIAMIGEWQRYQTPARDPTPHLTKDQTILKRLAGTASRECNWLVTISSLQDSTTNWKYETHLRAGAGLRVRPTWHRSMD